VEYLFGLQTRNLTRCARASKTTSGPNPISSPLPALSAALGSSPTRSMSFVYAPLSSTRVHARRAFGCASFSLTNFLPNPGLSKRD
jgi:hypothetical protein